MRSGIASFACAAMFLLTALSRAQEPSAIEAPAPKAESPAVPMPKVSGNLPWQTAKGGDKDRPVKLVSPRELLKLNNIDDSNLEQLRDDRPLVTDEDETLTKLMYRMPRFEPPLWERWCADKVPWSELATNPAQHRTECFLLRGRARRIERVEILKENVERFEYRHYYRVTIAIAGETNPAIVCTRDLPAAWEKVTELDEPVIVPAMFLKSGERAEEVQPFYFAAAHVGWYPDKVSNGFGVSEDWIWLSKRGFDAALWDVVRTRNGGSIVAEESETFYQLLAHLQRTSPADWKELKSRPFDLAALLQRPKELHGLAFQCTGVARSVKKVNVPESYRQRIGMDHYYEIDVLVPLDKQAVRLGSPDAEGKAPIYADVFPITLVVAKLPPNLPEGDVGRKQISLQGMFYKLWVYKSDFVESFDENMRQPSPLFMGLEPTVYVEDQSGVGLAGTTALFFVIIGLVGIVWVVAWRFARGDRQYERRMLRKFTHGKEIPDGPIGPPPENPLS